MKILYCYYYANLGGVSSVIKSRMPALGRNGWEVHAAFDQDFGGIADLLEHGIESAEVAGSVKDRLSTICDGIRPDVVALFDMPELVSPARSLGTKIVLEVHTPIPKNLLRLRPDDLAAVDRVIVPSEWSRSWISENIGAEDVRDRVSVVPNIIDRRIFGRRDASVKRERPLLLWVGKIAIYKRWQDAVRIMGALNATLPVDVCFATGSHCSPADSEAFLHELGACGLAGPVSWIHNAPIEQMAELYADVAASGGLLLSTSESESFCLAAHEAMSCAVPVVAARAGAITELLTDDLAGLTFEIGDLEAATRIAVGLLSDPEVRERVVLAGLRRQRDFDSGTLERLYLHTIEHLYQQA